ncbi:hypothetical protein [Noviherbaspirillum sedimenti]|uniref:hypothetical protein n=1 Tax=Noviherbaspirillum sedimenti TaxID=2320865 RepID=UPI0013149195|nr:hypothetical protein [Noviherbaspirillum sedimenti]
MNEKPVKVDIDFHEALRRIAKTPKGVIVPKDTITKKENSKEAEKKKPHPPRRKVRFRSIRTSLTDLDESANAGIRFLVCRSERECIAEHGRFLLQSMSVSYVLQKALEGVLSCLQPIFRLN